ncbi:hypothetical protein CLV30_109183 [Haloactinopolyspora alba]|uniref:Uncharacterized protein n=1 Tax=Haloactinopolyspora alba TaxID=648780 RepID=A0A2P8E063_9ACTN|nr:hypothetical protein [Haloactinopolyspora alba]PSL02875.1 hypothetical protein CLV30_109183 [Haloactinopolyspora alba]
MSAAHEQCRYLRRNGEQCTEEALDPEGEIVLCMKHCGRAMVMVRQAHEKRMRA